MRATVGLACMVTGCMFEAPLGGTEGNNQSTSLVEVALVSNPVYVNDDVDLLFVVDDSPGTLQLQASLVAALPSFTSALTSAGGLPNLHIGVVSSDLGVSAALDSLPGSPIGPLDAAGSCWNSGKRGELQTNGTTLVTGKFVSDIKNADGTRSVNYTGSLTDALGAMASLGAAGCGLEQHADAARRALNNNLVNAGFLRPTARLAVIMVADEDDCSMAHTTFASADTQAFGPLDSFRCTRFGVTCDSSSGDMNKIGEKSGCRSNESSDYLMPMASYVRFLKSLKTDPRDVMMAAIVGSTNPFEVELREPPGGGALVPALSRQCQFYVEAGSPDVVGVTPGVRLAELTDQFSRGTVENACNMDLSGAMSRVAGSIRNMIGDTCLSREIAMPAECEVFDTRLGNDIAIPACGDSMSTDCFRMTVDPDCTGPQHLRVDVSRSAIATEDTMVSVRCKL